MMTRMTIFCLLDISKWLLNRPLIEVTTCCRSAAWLHWQPANAQSQAEKSQITWHVKCSLVQLGTLSQPIQLYSPNGAPFWFRVRPSSDRPLKSGTWLDFDILLSTRPHWTLGPLVWWSWLAVEVESICLCTYRSRQSGWVKL